MPASTFDRLDRAIACLLPDIEAEADFFVMPEEVRLVTRGDESRLAEIRSALRRTLGSGSRALAKSGVLGFDLTAASAAGGAVQSADDLALVVAALGRAEDLQRGSLAEWGAAFGKSVRRTPAEMDSVEWVSLKLIVAVRRGSVSAMTLRRTIIGILAWCVVSNRPPPTVALAALACIVGLIDAHTAALVRARLDLLTHADTTFLLAVAACDAEAVARGDRREKVVVLASEMPDQRITRQKVGRVRGTPHYAAALANFKARNAEKLRALYEDDGLQERRFGVSPICVGSV